MALFPKYDGPPLMERLCHVETLTSAWQRVRSNIPLRQRGRSAGTDTVTIREFEADWSRQMGLLADDLRSGRYRPLPPRLVQIPKPQGGMRAIAILAIRDRIVLRAMQQVLEPLFDPYFLDCSYGCRPRIGVQDAVTRVTRYAEQGLTWVVDADIASYFDSLDQRILLALMRQRIPEVPMLRLVQVWLENGACATTESHGLPHPGGLQGLMERGRAVFHQFVDHPQYPGAALNDPYQAAQWEQPGLGAGLGMSMGIGTGLDGWGWDSPGAYSPVGMPHGREPSLLNSLWTAFLLGRPLIGAGQRALPYLKRIGSQRLMLAGTLTAGALAATELVMRWQHAAQRGTLQGAALSPLLGNVYLHPFDVALSAHGLRLVRFVDDFVVMCASQAEAEQALQLIQRQLGILHLSLNQEKTRIINYADGLDFLGEALAPRQRGQRLIDGVTSFDEAQERLRQTARNIRRKKS